MKNSQQYLCVINNFCHDLFTGVWVSTWLLLYLMSRESIPPALAGVWGGVLQRFFWLGPVSLVLILITGGLRVFCYRPAENRIKHKLLVIKHVLLALIFLAGTFFQFRIAFGYGV